MFCFIYKWMISGAMDTGKEMPGIVRRHLGRCESCHAFARMGQALDTRLKQDASELLKEPDTALNYRILAALESRPEPSYRRSRRASRFSPIPILSTAFALIVMVIGLAVITPGPGPKVSGDPSILDRILAVNESPVQDPKPALPGLMEKVESPFNREIASLKNAVVSAKDFFVTYVGEGFGTIPKAPETNQAASEPI